MAKQPAPQQQKDIWHRSFPRWANMLILIAIYIISLYLPLIGPVTQYPLQVIRCGGLPIIATKFAAGYHYYKPGNLFYAPHPFVDEYFCTEEEADRKYEPGAELKLFP